MNRIHLVLGLSLGLFISDKVLAFQTCNMTCTTINGITTCNQFCNEVPDIKSNPHTYEPVERPQQPVYSEPSEDFRHHLELINNM